MVAKVSPTLSAPLVLFTYYNPIIRRGMDKFCQQIKAAGAAGELGWVVGYVCTSLECYGLNYLPLGRWRGMACRPASHARMQAMPAHQQQ